MGFKPMTFRTGIWRSIQLSYGALFPAKIRLSFDVTKLSIISSLGHAWALMPFSQPSDTLFYHLAFCPRTSRKKLQRFSENLQHFPENLQRFLPNVGDKFETNETLFPHAPCKCDNNRQLMPIEVCKQIQKTCFSRVRVRAPTEILHFLLSQPSQISLQLPHPQREMHFFRTFFNTLNCFPSQDGENSPKNASRKARTEHWKKTKHKKTQRAVVPSGVKVVKAKNASLQGMRARDARVRETRLLCPTPSEQTCSLSTHFAN